jgi:hypothetical protein
VKVAAADDDKSKSVSGKRSSEIVALVVHTHIVSLLNDLIYNYFETLIEHSVAYIVCVQIISTTEIGRYCQRRHFTCDLDGKYGVRECDVNNKGWFFTVVRGEGGNQKKLKKQKSAIAWKERQHTVIKQVTHDATHGNGTRLVKGCERCE